MQTRATRTTGKSLRASRGDSCEAQNDERNGRGRAPAAPLRCLPSDQRDLCIGIDFEYAAVERWERIAAGGVA